MQWYASFLKGTVLDMKVFLLETNGQWPTRAKMLGRVDADLWRFSSARNEREELLRAMEDATAEVRQTSTGLQDWLGRLSLLYVFDEFDKQAVAMMESLANIRKGNDV
jgi:hypothetical protein